MRPEHHPVTRETTPDEVHRRTSDEARDERVLRTLVKALRRIDLLHDPLVQDDDALPERHRFRLVVRDVDRRHAEPAMELRELTSHLHPELRVEIRERLPPPEKLRGAGERQRPPHAPP